LNAKELESLTSRMMPMSNSDKGQDYERRYGGNGDGKWNCVDRAIVVKRMAEKNGMKAEYGHQKLKDNIRHRYINIDNGDGTKYPIFRRNE